MIHVLVAVVKNISIAVANNMKPDTLILDSDDASISIAGDIINNGGLVAFPTETVYGLGGNALNSTSISKIYKAKGRPSDNPLIVHIGDISMLKPLVKEIPEKAKLLIDAFFPGPLTLIFYKSELIPYEITAFKETVGIRFPQNDIARKLILASNVPIAAPSANISGKPSPTSFSHVKNDLDGKIDAIIKGDDSFFGLESTILDMTKDVPVMLRPGSITKSMIEHVIGEIEISSYLKDNIFLEDSIVPIAPGMKYKHYSPNASITIFKGSDEKVVKEIKSLCDKNSHLKIGILTDDKNKDFFDENMFTVLSVGNTITEIGKNLFNKLREFDKTNVDIIYSFDFQKYDDGTNDDFDLNFSVMNRLNKASGFNIIIVD